MGKVYAVVVGRFPGFYSSWPACQNQIKNYSKACYKSFTAKKDAALWMQKMEELAEKPYSEQLKIEIRIAIEGPLALRKVTASSDFEATEPSPFSWDRLEKYDLPTVPSDIKVPSLEFFSLDRDVLDLYKSKPEKKTIDNIINNPNPAWTKQPTDLQDEDYKSFYRELYPMQFEEPLFNIHLNVDYPFNLTGILYFPKMTNDMNMQKDKIQLYQNQVFVTDNVEGIVPEFLTMLRGVIDSPDIPLNVSRSYLQADGAVKKISSYITRKVADKLKSLFNNNREDFEAKWNDIKIVIEYGMLSEEKFFEKADAFALYPTVDGKYYTYEELFNKIKANQTDKDDKLVILYASNTDAQHSYIEAAKAKGYEVLLLDSPIVSHLIQKLESTKENISFARVDGDHIDNLINKEETKISKLTDEQKTELETVLKDTIPSEKFMVQLEAMDSNASPFIITQPEFMRRMKEMQQTGGGGMFGMGNMPEMYNLVVNTNSDLVGEILNTKTKKKQERLINQSLDLARLSQGLLKGEELTNFVKRSYELLK